MTCTLLIDDDCTLRTTIEAMLVSLGHSVVTAKNGRDGVEMFERQPFDLVVTDIVMPVQDGIETILQLRERRPSVKVIAASGGAPDGVPSRRMPPGLSVLDAALAIGASAVLSKPFTIDQLQVAVASALTGTPGSYQPSGAASTVAVSAGGRM